MREGLMREQLTPLIFAPGSSTQKESSSLSSLSNSTTLVAHPNSNAATVVGVIIIMAPVFILSAALFLLFICFVKKRRDPKDQGGNKGKEAKAVGIGLHRDGYATDKAVTAVAKTA
ncbi:unnamed protein product [Clavelina lepadiformis]|uniref:Uncharacterized protein n=1 Tax=Clavelina lepadiformis TaxID=159417 RepID=A0ABP0G0U7_CLALP